MPTTATTTIRKRNAWEIQRSVLFALVLREYRTRTGRHWTGVIWTLFEPLAHVFVILALFGYLRHMSSPNMEFPVFLVSGMMPFFLFRNLANRLTESVDTNRGLFSYRQVKPFDAVVARGIVECVLWLLVLVVTLLLLQWLGYKALPQRPLAFFGVAALAALLGGGLGLLLAVVTHGMPKVRSVVRMLFLPLYLTSGVIFSIDRLPARWVEWLLWNPLLHVVDLSRSAFEPRHGPLAGVGWNYPSSVALIMLALGLALYRRDRQKLLLGSAA